MSTVPPWASSSYCHRYLLARGGPYTVRLLCLYWEKYVMLMCATLVQISFRVCSKLEQEEFLPQLMTLRLEFMYV
jgi:hypothetical protein